MPRVLLQRREPSDGKLIRCGNCGHRQTDRGCRQTCGRCGFAPVQSYEYPKDCCFNPEYTKSDPILDKLLNVGSNVNSFEPLPFSLRSGPMPEALKNKKTAKKASKTSGTKKKATIAGKAKKEGELCHCGCGEMCTPGRAFKPGHDARFHSRVGKLKDGRLKVSELSKLGVKDYAIKYYKEAIS